ATTAASRVTPSSIACAPTAIRWWRDERLEARAPRRRLRARCATSAGPCRARRRACRGRAPRGGHEGGRRACLDPPGRAICRDRDGVRASPGGGVMPDVFTTAWDHGIPNVDLRAWHRVAGDRSPRASYGTAYYLEAALVERRAEIQRDWRVRDE